MLVVKNMLFLCFMLLFIATNTVAERFVFDSVKADNGIYCNDPIYDYRVDCDENNKIIYIYLSNHDVDHNMKNIPNDLFTSLPQLKRVHLDDTNIPILPTGLEYLNLRLSNVDVSDINFTQFTNLKELHLAGCKGVNLSNILSSNNFVNMEVLYFSFGGFDWLKDDPNYLPPLPNLRNMATFPKLTSFTLYHNGIFNDEAIEASGMQVSDVENLYYQEGANYYDRNFDTFPANKFPSLQNVKVVGSNSFVRSKITYNGNDFQITIPPNNLEQYIVFPSDSNVNLGELSSNISAENPDTNPLLTCSSRGRTRYFHIALHCPFFTNNPNNPNFDSWENNQATAICIPNEDLLRDGNVVCVADKPCLWAARKQVPDEVPVSSDANSACSEYYPDVPFSEPYNKLFLFKKYKYIYVKNPSSNSHGAITISGTISGGSVSSGDDSVSSFIYTDEYGQKYSKDTGVYTIAEKAVFFEAGRIYEYQPGLKINRNWFSNGVESIYFTYACDTAQLDISSIAQNPDNINEPTGFDNWMPALRGWNQPGGSDWLYTYSSEGHLLNNIFLPKYWFDNHRFLTSDTSHFTIQGYPGPSGGDLSIPGSGRNEHYLPNVCAFTVILTTLEKAASSDDAAWINERPVVTLNFDITKPNGEGESAEPVSTNPCDNENPCLNGGKCKYNANNDQQRCECTLKWYGKTCALPARKVKPNMLPPSFRQFLTDRSVPLKNIVRDSKWADYDDNMMREVRKTAMKLISYYKVPNSVADDWSNTKLRKFGSKIVNMMNRQGRFILTTENIAVTISSNLYWFT